VRRKANVPPRPVALPVVTLPRIFTLAALLTAALAGCSSPSKPPAAPSTTTSPPAGAASPTATAAPAATAWDARTVLAKLTAGGLPISNGAVQDENSDPNHLLGRPGGYLSRASFDVPGGDTEAPQFSIDRGGVVEVWPDAAAAKRRAEFIAQTLASSPVLGTEYHYLNGPVLVRLSGTVTPTVAKRFERAVAGLGT
jgi:hypothetical protein